MAQFPLNNDGTIAAIIASLPAHAQVKLMTIEARSSAISAQNNGRAERLEAKTAAINAVREHAAHYDRQDLSKASKADKARRAAMDESIAQLKAERASIQKSGKDLPRDISINNFREELLTLRRFDGFEDARVEVKTPKGGDYAAAVEAIRAEITQLLERRDQIENAWLPRADAERRIMSEIESMAAKGAVKFDGACRLVSTERATMRRQGRLEWPRHYVAGYEQGHGLALAAWLHREALISRATAFLDLEYDGREAFGVDERARMIAEIDGEILLAERREEALIEAAETIGTIVGRLGRASVMAVLGIAPDPLAIREPPSDKPSGHVAFDPGAPVAGKAGGDPITDIAWTVVSGPRR